MYGFGIISTKKPKRSLEMIDENSVEKIVYLRKGGPSILTTISTGSGIVDHIVMVNSRS
ncbi:hypothetical protein P9265_01715 [Schinkia azotoformans]|uniref:hypothetical protein n=1 Tax=Schinkia azotoformans TaxID=1454 RepID=UPI002E1D8326|nr:hypothetical protein [Schinkia azotoformans]